MSDPTEEQSSNFFIFDTREIFPKGFSKGTGATEKKFVGSFMMVDGDDSYPARYIEEKNTWIPKDVSNPNKPNNINKSPTYNEILIMFAELYYGAKWNPETAQLEQDEESHRWKKPKPREMSEYLGKFSGMDHWQSQLDAGTKPRIKRKDGIAIKYGVAGFGKDMMGRYTKVVLAYNNPTKENIKKGIKPILGKKRTEAERQRDIKTEFKARPAEAEQMWRKAFYDHPYIEKWRKLLEDAKETSATIVSGIARIFLINNLLDPNNFKDLTIGLSKEPDEVRIKKLKHILAIWKKWNSKYLTPKEFYEQEWTDKLYDKDVKLRFPDGIWEALKEFNEREHKGGLPRDYDGEKMEESSRKTGADYLVAFITLAPEGRWGLSENQPSGSMLSRKIATPRYKKIGQNVSDKQVREAMKFLETGKIHHWEQKKDDGKLVFTKLEMLDETQKVIIKYQPVNDLLPNEDDDNPHYNKALKEYEIYETPYGKTKPASLLFRLSILCGWRKVEALTTPTRFASESTLLELADFKFKKKPSGLEVDMERGVLKVSFLTRKTKKTGKTYTTAIIPPFSSSIMDARETIAYVCEKAGIGHFADKQFYKYHDEKDEEGKSYHIETPNPNWNPKIIEYTAEEKDELYPKRTFKTRKETIITTKGTPSEWLIGEDGQFYRMKSRDEDVEIPTYDLPKGTGKGGLAGIEEKEMIRAYLDFPLRECYAVMSAGTTVGYQTDAFVMNQAEDDYRVYKEQNKQFRVFSMDKGWSSVCDMGCPEFDIGKIQVGKYSKERMNQDQEKYKTKDQPYWLKKSIHSLRHLFAQLWLRKSDWNFGIVADRGHWETLDTLKKHYGGVPDKFVEGFMYQVLGKDQVGDDVMNQAINRDIALQLQKSGDVKDMTKSEVKQREDDTEETKDELEEEIADA